MGNVQPFVVARGWTCWVLWTGGVLLRWTTNLYSWNWRGVLPLSALMEIGAFLIFFHSVGRHKRRHPESAKRNGEGHKREIWMKLVLSSTIGFLLTLLANLGSTLYVSLTGATPALPHVMDQRFLVLAMWGFITLSIWGFSARWLRVFLGLRKPDDRMLLLALTSVGAGVITVIAGAARLSSVLLLLLLGAVCAVFGLHIFAGPSARRKHREFIAVSRSLCELPKCGC